MWTTKGRRRRPPAFTSAEVVAISKTLHCPGCHIVIAVPALNRPFVCAKCGAPLETPIAAGRSKVSLAALVAGTGVAVAALTLLALAAVLAARLAAPIGP